MTAAKSSRSALVFGATGFLGTWLVKELLNQGVETTAAVRSTASAGRLTRWLSDRDAPLGHLKIVQVDLSVDGLGLDASESLQVGEVYNAAGAYSFGMSIEDARSTNVDGARRVVDWTASLPSVTRLVHVSGYRVGGQDPTTVPWSPDKVAGEYKRLGAYEASKVEGDAVVQSRALELGVPLTVVNPSTVIGDSVTGESIQVVGLATTVLELLSGELQALPGGSTTFVPVVTVDYLARFMAILPTADETAGRSYWVLDDLTPALPHLLRLIGEHRGVRVPRLRLPVSLLKRLPMSITRADPETLSFLSADRYPHLEADALAYANGLQHPDVVTSLQRWADHLAAR